MSDTPKTDMEEKIWSENYSNSREAGWPSIGGVVPSDLARHLEREVNALKNKLITLEGSKDAYQFLAFKRSVAIQNILEEASEALK